jgi:DNA-binding NtrC family response regulator
MAKRKVLLQWIGHSDLRAMAASLTATRREALMAKLGGVLPKDGDLGPTKTLLTTQTFDEIRLLSNYPAEWGKWFVTWLGVKADLVQVALDKPTDYAAIYRIANGELGKIRDRDTWSETGLCLHLSPGTPAMAAVWLLLGKTRYPATFFETYGGRSWVTEVPFDLTIDVIPEILRDPDAHLQHLASQSPSEIEGFRDIAGDSRAIRDAVGRAKRAAMRGISILLLGESGTGKEMFAQAIHKASPRRDKPLLAINCAALAKTLLESELFGHTRGAFTGADKERKGAFELADGGTIFLDEIAECDLETQAKLLRVLQPIPGQGPSVRAIRRLGDDRDRLVDVRVIAATNRDLHKAIRDGAFREDLYYRLATVTITLPALRDRKADISKIAERLLDQINRQFASEEPNYQHKSLSASATAFVKRHDWPGNVRQLYNVLVQAAVLAEGPTLDRSDLVAALGEMASEDRTLASLPDRPMGGSFDLEEFLNNIHASYLRRAMQEAQGVKAEAARLLGIKHYQTLDAQLKRLKIQSE